MEPENTENMINFSKATKCADFQNLSIMERITVVPEKDGRPVMKSKAVWDQGL